MRIRAILCLAGVLSGCASTLTVNPVTGTLDPVRYERGVPTVTADLRGSSLQVTPLGFDSSGQIEFGVAAYNSGPSPADFGGEDVEMFDAAGRPLRTFSAVELERRARNRARVATAVTLVAGGLAAYGAVSSARYTSHGYVSTPGGVSRFSVRSYDPGTAYAGVALATAGTVATAAAIHGSLDHTLDSINGRMLSRTTIDPGESFGGVAVGEKLKGDLPQDVDVRVSWKGESHDFRFRVAQER